MARTTRTVLVDDVTGEEGEDVRTHTFHTLDGKALQIDLGADEWCDLDEALRECGRIMAKWVGAARPATQAPRRRTTAPSGDAGVQRAWARANGISVRERGRIPGGVTEAWRAAGSPR